MADSPCMKNRSLKAGGRLNRWSFKAGFTVVQRRKKIGRNRRQRKVIGLEETGKERKNKSRPEKTEETGSASTGERRHQQLS